MKDRYLIISLQEKNMKQIASLMCFFAKMLEMMQERMHEYEQLLRC